MIKVIALLLQRIRELEKLARHDSLSGCLNHYALEQTLPNHHSQITVIAVDIKGLTQVNLEEAPLTLLKLYSDWLINVVRDVDN